MSPADLGAELEGRRGVCGGEILGEEERKKEKKTTDYG